MQIERKFLNSFHNAQTTNLKKEIQQEKWIPYDIPFEFY